MAFKFPIPMKAIIERLQPSHEHDNPSRTINIHHSLTPSQHIYQSTLTSHRDASTEAAS